jgi:hypothetical protein
MWGCETQVGYDGSVADRCHVSHLVSGPGYGEDTPLSPVTDKLFTLVCACVICSTGTRLSHCQVQC